MELPSGGQPLSAETWEYILTLAYRMGDCRHQEVEVYGCMQDLEKAKSKELAIQVMEVGLR